jgi:sulfur-oxidizing protein SoxZ
MTALITLPKSIKKDETIEIKTLVSHHMETGYRRDMAGRVIARDILKEFIVFFNNKPIFEAVLSPAIAANPYVAFFYKVEQPGEMRFIWRDEKGGEIVETRTLTFS